MECLFRAQVICFPSGLCVCYFRFPFHVFFFAFREYRHRQKKSAPDNVGERWRERQEPRNNGGVPRERRVEKALGAESFAPASSLLTPDTTTTPNSKHRISAVSTPTSLKEYPFVNVFGYLQYVVYSSSEY